MPDTERTILVIGAGVAGLAAARDLSGANLRVTLLEARDRVGGRVYTLHDESGAAPIELGAEFVHGRPSSLLSTLDSARLLYCDVTEHHWYFENGVLSKSGDFWHKVNRLMSRMNTSELDRSLTDFLNSLPDDPETNRAKAMTMRYVEGFHAANADRIGIHGLIKANEAEYEIQGDSSLRVISGYQSVAESLRRQAEQAGATIHFNTMVREIHWDKSRVEVICTRGDESVTFVAAAAVVTLPLGVLQVPSGESGGVRFVPELPANLQEAISTLVMGQVVKITLRFHRRFWESLSPPGMPELSQLGFIHNPDAAFPTWWTLLPLRVPYLVGWVGGPDADAMLGDDAGTLIKHALESLSRILMVSESYLRGELEDAYAHNWKSDPFARGAYAYVPVSGLAAQEALAHPVEKTLFFAGEATSLGHIGTVHGALMSGERAARQIVVLSTEYSVY